MPLVRKSTPDAETPAPGGSAASLASPDPEERWAAARNLLSPDDVGLLASALKREDDLRVREAILTSLAAVGTSDAAAAVVPHIHSDDAAVRTGALDALRAMPRALAATLETLLKDGDSDVRILACDLARGLSGPEAELQLCDLLDREAEANVCAAAVEALAEIGGVAAIPALTRCRGRFASEPFLAFSIAIALERIDAPSGGSFG